jgi:hypothetical protein
MGSHSSKEDIYEANIKKCMYELEKYEIKSIKDADDLQSNHLRYCTVKSDNSCTYGCIKKGEYLKKNVEERINYYEKRIKYYQNLKNNNDTIIQVMPDAPPEYNENISK